METGQKNAIMQRKQRKDGAKYEERRGVVGRKRKEGINERN